MSLAIGTRRSGPSTKSAIRPITPSSAQPRPNSPIAGAAARGATGTAAGTATSGERAATTGSARAAPPIRGASDGEKAAQPVRTRQRSVDFIVSRRS